MLIVILYAGYLISLLPAISKCNTPLYAQSNSNSVNSVVEEPLNPDNKPVTGEDAIPEPVSVE